MSSTKTFKENNRDYRSPSLLKISYCLKIHNAHFKLASPMSGQLNSFFFYKIDLHFNFKIRRKTKSTSALNVS